MTLARRQVLVAVAAAAHSELAFFGDEAGLIELREQVVQIVIGLEDNIASAAAVAAAGAAFGNECFAMKRDAAFAAVAGAGEDFDFIDKHSWKEKGRGHADLALVQKIAA